MLYLYLPHCTVKYQPSVKMSIGKWCIFPGFIRPGWSGLYQEEFVIALKLHCSTCSSLDICTEYHYQMDKRK